MTLRCTCARIRLMAAMSLSWALRIFTPTFTTSSMSTSLKSRKKTSSSAMKAFSYGSLTATVSFLKMLQMISYYLTNLACLSPNSGQINRKNKGSHCQGVSKIHLSLRIVSQISGLLPMILAPNRCCTRSNLVTSCYWKRKTTSK